MAYLAQCAPERVPMLLVEGAIDEVQERLQALTALSEVSLVKHDPFDDGTEALSTHRLVQSAARARMQSKGLEQNAIDRVIERLQPSIRRTSPIPGTGRYALNSRRIYSPCEEALAKL